MGIKCSTYYRLLHYLRHQSERSDLWAEDLLNELVADPADRRDRCETRGDRGNLPAWPSSEPSS